MMTKIRSPHLKTMLIILLPHPNTSSKHELMSLMKAVHCFIAPSNALQLACFLATCATELSSLSMAINNTLHEPIVF